MNFINMKEAVASKIDSMKNTTFFWADIDLDKIFDLYLSSFPEGTNPMFRERTQHDCNCCKTFIRQAGGIVFFNDNGELTTIWDIEVEGEYQVVADALSAYVRSCGLKTIYLHEKNTVGTDKNKDNYEDITWDHFYTKLPESVVCRIDDIASRKGKALNNYNVLKRSLTEITDDAIATVLDLISNNSIYKGEENLSRLGLLRNTKALLEESTNKEQFYWEQSLKLGEGSSFRNSAIGTLLVDLSEGKDLESAVKSYEDKVAPENYKRSSAVVTQAMINRAEKTLVEKGLENSIQRRHAVVEDITINDVLFADRTAKVSMGVLGGIKPTAKKEVKVGETVDISIDDFLSTVVPKTDSMEILVTGEHQSNFMSLVAPVNHEAPAITKWDNNFSWSYNGEIADSSMRKEVTAKGGRVDGAFRFTHSWNHDGQNQSLMDLHVFLPANGSAREGIHDRYGNSERVGWNNRNHHQTGGVQDVDFTSPPGSTIPLENITFPYLDKMPEGNYICAVHNWSSRKNPKSGFKAEIEFGGNLFQYDYPNSLKNEEWVIVAEVSLKGGNFTINHKIPTSTETSAEVYGIQSGEFHKVNLMMKSPNYWDSVENPKGNRHWFFILDGCKNENPVRGFYNEFLTESLHNDRKVFEHLGSQMKVPFSENQLSGLGFSSTQKNNVIVKVRGEINRNYNIKF